VNPNFLHQIKLKNDNFWSRMIYFTFTVGTFLHPTLYVLNMQVDMFMGEEEVCAVLQHNTVGSTHCLATCPPYWFLPFSPFTWLHFVRYL